MINIRVPHDLLAALQERAKELSVPYQSLLKHLLQEGLLRSREPGWRAPTEGRSASGSSAYTAAKGTVYFIQTEAPSRVLKIGVTTRTLQERFNDLQKDYPLLCPFTLLHSMPGSRKIEKNLHLAFAHLHQGSEWFTPAPELLAYIEARKAEAPSVAPLPDVHTQEPELERSAVPPEGEPLNVPAEPSGQQPEPNEAVTPEQTNHVSLAEPLPPAAPSEEETPWDFLDSV